MLNTANFIPVHSFSGIGMGRALLNIGFIFFFNLSEYYQCLITQLLQSCLIRIIHSFPSTDDTSELLAFRNLFQHQIFPKVLQVCLNIFCLQMYTAVPESNSSWHDKLLIFIISVSRLRYGNYDVNLIFENVHNISI